MSEPWFELVGSIEEVETIAVARSIRVLDRLVEAYGSGRWRKKKGVGSVRLPNGEVVTAELHWYECHGIGRREYKIKRFLE